MGNDININFKKYKMLLVNLSAESPLKKVITLRLTPMNTINDPELKKYKESITLNKKDNNNHNNENLNTFIKSVIKK